MHEYLGENDAGLLPVFVLESVQGFYRKKSGEPDQIENTVYPMIELWWVKLSPNWRKIECMKQRKSLWFD